MNAARQPESRRSLDPAVSPEPRRSPTSLLLALPDDVLQRVLVGVPRDDHDVAALVCKRTRGIITGPHFSRPADGMASRNTALLPSLMETASCK